MRQLALYPRTTFYATLDRSLLASTLHAWIPGDTHYLLSAPSFLRGGVLRQPPLPAQVQDIAVDAGGFAVAKHYGGTYPFTLDDYTRWLQTIRPAWAATMDYPLFAPDTWPYRMEDARTGQILADFPPHRPLVWYYRFLTAQMTAAAARHDVSWAWVPTVQGVTIDDYREHARAVAAEVATWPRHPAERVGIGAIKGRTPAEAYAIVEAIAHEIPDRGFHLWGGSLMHVRYGLHPRVISFDTSVWNSRFADKIEKQKGSGMTQREYAFRIALPAYARRIEGGLT